MSKNFKEFEHKYLLETGADTDSIFADLRKAGDGKEKQLVVTDIYYRDSSLPGYIYRHRKDEEIQQLTVKSYGGDTRERTEVNLHLKNDRDQFDAVEAFLKTLGEFERFEIHKKIRVIDFQDCECVYYEASSGTKIVHCFEFEALGTNNLEDAMEIIAKYESAAGFDPAQRCELSLFDLLHGKPEG